MNGSDLFGPSQEHFTLETVFNHTGGDFHLEVFNTTALLNKAAH